MLRADWAQFRKHPRWSAALAAPAVLALAAAVVVTPVRDRIPPPAGVLIPVPSASPEATHRHHAPRRVAEARPVPAVPEPTAAPPAAPVTVSSAAPRLLPSPSASVVLTPVPPSSVVPVSSSASPSLVPSSAGSTGAGPVSSSPGPSPGSSVPSVSGS